MAKYVDIEQLQEFLSKLDERYAKKADVYTKEETDAAIKSVTNESAAGN